jgi:Tol biopolymer transport system component/urease beta subunit
MFVLCLALALAALTAAASAAQGDLDLVSRATGAAGAKANGSSDNPAISADGRFVAFRSVASNLDPADGDATGDVFVRDEQANTTRLVSRASGADGAKGNGNSSDATISADGRFVAFESGASNLGAGGTAGLDTYVRDLQANTTTLVDRANGADGAPANSISLDAAISANGRFVAFSSLASNLSPDDGAEIEDVFVRDLQTNTTTLVSRASGAGGAAGDSNSQAVAISADGRFVAFSSFAANLDPADRTGDEDIFVRDLQTNTTTLVSRATGASGAKANGLSDEPAISADGRAVAFLSNATNLDPADNDTTADIYVRDLQTNNTTLASRATGAAGTKANDISLTPRISGDGRYVTFSSFAGNLDPDVTLNFINHVFERDLQANTTTLVSRAAGAAGAAGDSSSAHPAISADGRFLVFDSRARNLHPADGDTTLDIFRREVLDTADQAARISVDDVTMAEGDAGQTAFRFTVSLDQAQSAAVTVDFSTANGTATAPGDYAPASGTVIFAPGETAKTVTVQVNGDTTVEPDESFNVNLANAGGNATIADAVGIATIVNDDQPVIEQPSRISIDGVSLAEGDSGQTAFRFTVSLDRAQSAPVAVDFSTADATATAPSDYVANSGTVTFAPGETAKTVTVQVNGDTAVEPDETFTVNLANAAGNATIADAQAIATIANDDQPVIEPPARISIGDVRMAEGNGGQTGFRFTVSLDQAQSAPVTVDFSTANGTATAPGDYAPASGTVTFAPGETAKTVTVPVSGDTTKEPNETFTLNLSDATGNATIADGQALGTIVNDDRKGAKHFALGQVRLNRKAGTARLAVTVPGSGKLTIAGNGVKAGQAVVARSVRAPRTVLLPIKATGKAERRLNRTGKVTVKPKVTYTPIGGTPSTRSGNLRLEKL